MSVVAISQTLGSLGDEIGKALAGRLGWRFADREIVLAAADRYGGGVVDLERATESRPSLWERMADTQRHYLTFMEAIVFEMAAGERVVFSGRGVPFVLRGVAHVLRVRITAPVSVRAQRIAREHRTTAEAAAEFVRQSDRERAARMKFLYHVDWDDPLLYDLVLNTGRMDLDEGVTLLQQALAAPRLTPTEASRGSLRDLSLTARAKAALLVHGQTRLLPLAVTCRDGEITLSGVVPHEALCKVAEEAVAGIPGVVRVRNDLRASGQPPVM
jgi:cytidylate kinase